MQFLKLTDAQTGACLMVNIANINGLLSMANGARLIMCGTIYSLEVREDIAYIVGKLRELLGDSTA